MLRIQKETTQQLFNPRQLCVLLCPWPIRRLRFCNNQQRRVRWRRLTDTRKGDSFTKEEPLLLQLTDRQDRWVRADTPAPVTKGQTFQPPVDLQSIFVSGPVRSHNANGSKKDAVPRLKWSHRQPPWASRWLEQSWKVGSWLTFYHPLQVAHRHTLRRHSRGLFFNIWCLNCHWGLHQ